MADSVHAHSYALSGLSTLLCQFCKLTKCLDLTKLRLVLWTRKICPHRFNTGWSNVINHSTIKVEMTMGTNSIFQNTNEEVSKVIMLVGQ